MSPDRPPPPDQEARDKIESQLDRSLLVEAAAGTGKTTSMVGRMVALLAEGKCEAGTLAAVTFTRKAAAEIRGRFRKSLEQAIDEADGARRERLQRALQHQQRCFIGTIHAFCARLLRERPIEAGVDPGFGEADEATDHELRARAWRQYADTLLAIDDPVVEELERAGLQLSRSTTRKVRQVDELEELGLELPQLGAAFMDMAEFPEIDDWPAQPVPQPEFDALRKHFQQYLQHLEEIGVAQIDAGKCKLLPKLHKLLLAAAHIDWQTPVGLMELMEHFDGADTKATHRWWPGEKDQAVPEQDRWHAFRDERAGPALRRWREHRYSAVIDVLRPAMDVYRQLREEANLLSFQDLLIKARGLLLQTELRQYFRGRITHLLVDEFQDTDPLQAELMLLLTADDPEQNDWRRCRPVPGSLFVVGDPKQSIYRFRRADMEIYSAVQGIFREVGEVVELSANFRSSRPMIEWINEVFEVFPEQGSDLQAARRPLDHGGAEPLDAAPIERPPIDETAKPLPVAREEAKWIAQRINEMMEAHDKLEPSDFMLLTPTRYRLSEYARALHAVGLPHNVTGGSELNRSPELRLLRDALLAVTRTHDAVALLAVLRGELFGISDRVLYAWRAAGGRIQLWNDPPDQVDGEGGQQLRRALDRLRRHVRWLGALPLAVAVERIADDLGLAARAAARSSSEAGAFAKAIELLRTGAMDGSASDLLERIESLTGERERRDGAPAIASDRSPVQLMNLHQAKGLEAKVVFLADPNGRSSDHVIRRHVERLGDHPRGYLAVYSQQDRTRQWSGKRRAKPKLLACPPGWDQFEQRERAHEQAEQLRLMYVAATRAGAKLICCPRAKNNNPWSFFAEQMPPAHLPAGDPAAAPAEQHGERGDEAAAPSPAPVAAGCSLESIGERWQAVKRPTMQVGPLKRLALRGAERGPTGRDPDGALWGSAVHTVLEAMLKVPQSDPLPLATSALLQQDLDPGRAPELIEMLRRVQDSTIWQRAMASQERHCEAPLTTLLPSALQSLAPGTSPVLVRGVIDLVFREPSGWVVVDFKSDQLELIELEAASAHYQGQLDAYAAAWEHLTGEPVVERGLLFTYHARYIKRS